MRHVLWSLAAASLVCATASVGSAVAQPSPGTYVVVVDPRVGDVSGLAAALGRRHGGSVGFVYSKVLHGFSMRIPATGAAAIARNPSVASVERDQEYTVAAQSLPTGVQRVFASANGAIGIDGADDTRVDVDVAVIDSGIDLDHPDLNVVGSTNCATFFATCGAGGDDSNGHGTHVAGTIGALDNGIGVVGVAPGARLWAVRVLGNNGTGTTSQIIAGMDWVTARASTIEVANVSISGGASAAVDTAANRMADAGIAVAVAAGNNDANASGYSPARAAKVLTVSAVADYDGLPGALAQPPSSFCLDQDDTLLDISNWGSTIEVAAPGCRILSTYAGGGYAWINGTSMASPHVAGALALLASRGFARSYAGVSGLYATVVGSGNTSWLDESGDGVTEPLLDVSGPAFAPAQIGTPANEPPGASFTSSCNGLACSFNASASSDPDGSIVAYAWTFGDGGTASGSTTAHTYSTAGTYSVTLTTTDDDGATGTTSKSVTVTSPPTVALSGSRVSNGSTWTATVTIAVTSGGSPVALSSSGAWSNGASGSASCSTTPAPCTVSKSGIRNRQSSVTFTVNTVGGGTGFAGTKSIVVQRP
jgi:subtilisin family serine protease